jgi:hypothetical protein
MAATCRLLESVLGQVETPGGDARAAAVRRLCLAQQIYLRAHHRPYMRRQAMFVALDAVLKLLRCLDETSELVGPNPLADLANALMDLDRGIPSPLFEPSPTDGRRPDSHDRVATKSAAAAAMTLLMDAGHGREKAAKLVADKLRGAGVALEGWKTVAAWRDQVRRLMKAPAHGRDRHNVQLPERLAELANDGLVGTYRLVVELLAGDPLKQDRERFSEFVLTFLLALAGAPPPEFAYQLIGRLNARTFSK